ncbi:hypothetical protein GS491_19105 [Rhodococcus hoagii]|nr:hypothetical protein [Prescottella equi]NKT01820.1 hypothetical protein [Prescottella equi]
MAEELTPEREAAIREGHALGRSQADIARELEIPQPIVSRWAKRLGIVWTISPNVAAMNDRTRERIAAGRALLAEKALAHALNLSDRIWEEYEVYISTPAGIERKTLELPDAKAVSDFSNAVQKLVATHENLTRLGAGSSADHAKSMLNQLMEQARQLVNEEGEEV